LLEEVEGAFEYRLGDLDFDVTGDSHIDFEAEPIEAVLQYIDSQKIGPPTAIAAEEGVAIRFSGSLRSCPSLAMTVAAQVASMAGTSVCAWAPAWAS
jgi:hypothetical protein